jgi:hypothetical protein
MNVAAPLSAWMQDAASTGQPLPASRGRRILLSRLFVGFAACRYQASIVVITVD